MTDDQLFGHCTLGDFGCLLGGGMEGFLGSCRISLQEGSLMEQQVHSLDLVHNFGQTDRVRAISIAS